MIEQSDESALEPVAIYAADHHLAGRAASLLRADGILATTDSDAGYGWVAPLDSTRVLVRRADAERALALLREHGLVP